MISSKSRSVQPRLQERRRNLRQSVTPLVYLKVSPNNGGLLLDLCESGMCVSLAKPLANFEKISFSFSLVEPRMIEGVGRICWVSGSGRRAGVQFVEPSKMPIEEITAWLDNEGMRGEENSPRLSAKEVKESESRTQVQNHASSSTDSRTGRGPRYGDVIDTEQPGDGMSSNGQQGSAKPPGAADSPAPVADAPSRQHTAVSPGSQHESGLTIPDTPLFFLPQKREELEDLIPDSAWESAQPAFSEGRRENTAFESVASGSGLAFGSVEKENKRRKTSGLGKAVARMAFLFVLAVLCFAVYRYEGPILNFQGFAPAAKDVSIPKVEKKAKRRRSVHRGLHHRRDSSEIRRVAPIRSVLTVPVSGPNGRTFSIQGVVPGAEGFSFQGVGVAPSSGGVTNASAGEGPKSFPVENTGNGRSTTRSARSDSTVTFIGLMATLRNDGALVVEGGFTPSSPHASKATPGLERIVLDVLVGKNGQVSGVKLISSPDSKLAAAVIRSVRKWRYRPVYENGEAVPFTTRITLDLSQSSRNP